MTSDKWLALVRPNELAQLAKFRGLCARSVHSDVVSREADYTNTLEQPNVVSQCGRSLSSPLVVS